MCSSADAGVYAVVTRAARSAELVQQASRLAVGPMISAALARGRQAEVKRLHRDVALGTALLSWPFFVIAAYFAPVVLSLFGPDFTAGATALRILCLGLALSYAAGGVQSILLMGGRSTAQLGNKVACLVLNVGLNLALVPRLGIVGAATAWAVVLVLDAAMAWLQILAGMRLRLATAGACLLADRWAGPVVAMFAATAVVLVLGTAATTAALLTSVPSHRRRRPRSRSEARRIGDVGKAQ
jgi:O-antigen/teichoic acid export membrane protein